MFLILLSICFLAGDLNFNIELMNRERGASQLELSAANQTIEDLKKVHLLLISLRFSLVGQIQFFFCLFTEFLLSVLPVCFTCLFTVLVSLASDSILFRTSLQDLERSRHLHSLADAAVREQQALRAAAAADLAATREALATQEARIEAASVRPLRVSLADTQARGHMSQ